MVHLSKSTLVLCVLIRDAGFDCATLELSRSEHTPRPPATVQKGQTALWSRVWYHVALQYQSPWRPTYLLLRRRDHEFGDANCVPLEIVDGSHGLGCSPTLVFMALWEMLSRLDIDKPLTMRWFKLEASTSYGVAKLRPAHQRAVPILEPQEFWKGSEWEASMRRARRQRRRKPAEAKGAVGRVGRADLVALVDGSLAEAADRLEEEVPDGELDMEGVLPDSGDSGGSGDDGLGSDADSHNPFGVPFECPPLVGEGGPRAEGQYCTPSGPESSSSDSGSSSSSDSGSSSSSSDSGSSDCDSSLAERPLKIELGHGLIGTLHYTHIGDRLEFYAICPCKRQHGKCVMTRTLRPGSRPFQGRPLGFLSAWLLHCNRFAEKDSHMKFKPTLVQRVEGRSLVKSLTRGLRFLALERPLRDGEREEPDNFV